MNIKKYASHSKFKEFGCEIVNNRYPQTYSFIEEILQGISPTCIPTLDIDLLIFMDEWVVDRNFEGYPLGKLIPASMQTATFRFIAKILEIPVIHVVTTFRAIPTGYMYDENQTKLYRTCYKEYLEETLKDMDIPKDANVLIMPMRAADGYDILTKQAIKSSIKQLNNYANEI